LRLDKHGNRAYTEGVETSKENEMTTKIPMTLILDVIRYKDAVAMIDNTGTYPRFVMWGKNNNGTRTITFPNNMIAKI
jgi:hypothetical protein